MTNTVYLSVDNGAHHLTPTDTDNTHDDVTNPLGMLEPSPYFPTDSSSGNEGVLNWNTLGPQAS